MKVLIRSFLLAGLLGCLLTFGVQSARAVPAQKTVLVLSPFQFDLANNLIAAQAMREEFGKASDLSLDVYYEYLDLNRFTDSVYQQEVFDLLTTKYKNKQVDLVIVGSEAMLKLWLAQRADILPNTPIVFFDVFTEHLGALNLPANVTGVSAVEDCEKSVQWALTAMPAVNEIVLVGGVGKIEQGFFDHLRKMQEELKEQVKFTDMAGLPLAEIKQRVAKLPKTSIVLYHPMFEDAEATKYRPLAVLRELTAASSVPVISGYDVFIGTGIIGGYMYSIDQQARDAAQIGLRVLRAEAMNSIPIVQDESDRFIFDHLALQRFGIPLSLLPPDSIVKNRQYSFWELYQPQIIATGTGIVVLLLLVVFLLGVTQQLNHTRLALADLNLNLETQVQERTALLNQTNTQLQDEISKHKRTEEKLLKSESSFQAVLQSTADGILAVDSDNRVLFVNERFVEMWQIPAEVLARKDDTALLQHVLEQLINPQEFLDKVQELYQSEQESFDSLNFKDGRVFERLSRILIREQKASGRVWSFRDVTTRKRMEEELRESERRTANILRFSPIVIGVSTAAEGLYTDVNDSFENVLGYSQAETVGRTSFDLNLWVDDDTRPNILREIQAHGRVENLEIRLRRKSGEIFPALIFITPIVLHDTPCLLTMMMDITSRKRAEEQLRDTRDTLQTIIHSSPLAILALDYEDRLTMWNPAAEAMFGWSDKQILGQANPTVPENKLKEYEALRQATLSGMAFSNLDTLRLTKNGNLIPVSLSVAPLRGQQSQVIGRMHIIADITDRKKLQEELRQQATTDELTRVSNRRHFMELAQGEIKRALRLKRPPAVALIDIDHFKQVNDTLGHAAGDQALVAFTKICQKQIREIDVFARFGGDEFVLLLPETSQEQAYEVLERVRLAVTAQPLNLGGIPVALTISAGIANLSNGQESFDMVLSQADQALYRAKEAGRNKVIRCDIL